MNTKTTIFMRSCAALLTAALMSPSTATAGAKTGADFLKLPVDAQPTATGQAYTALANGPAALNWNPAGIARMGGSARSALSLSHQQLFFNSHLEQINFIQSAGGGSTWGFHLLRLAYEDQDAFDASGSPSGSLSSSDMSAGLAMSSRWNSLQVGGQFKWIRQDLAGEVAQGPAVDIGLLSPTPFRRLSVGLSVRNLGPKMKFVSEEFNLPLTVSGGLGYRLNNAINIAADLHSRPYDDEMTAALGVEFHAMETLALRAGYLERVAQAISSAQQSETERGSFGNLSGFSAGMGLKLGTMGLDYAFSPFGELGNVHAITLSAAFGSLSDSPSVAGPVKTVLIEDSATYNLADEKINVPVALED